MTKVSLYVKYDANYMVQFMPNVAGMGFSENAPLVLDGSGSQHIQIDKKVNTITWAYDDVRYGKDAYLEHGTAEIIAVNGTPWCTASEGSGQFLQQMQETKMAGTLRQILVIRLPLS